MFNQPVQNSDQNGQNIGKVDEVFGQQNSYYFSVNPSEGVGLDSIKKGQKIFMDKAFLLPLTYI
jgi:rRNA processing protein Gar1